MTTADVKKMKTKDQVRMVMQGIEKNGSKIADMDSQLITLTYYFNLHGIDKESTVYDFFKSVMNKEMPAYETVTRVIRKLREENPAWMKPESKVKEQVEHVKKEIDQ